MNRKHKFFSALAALALGGLANAWAIEQVDGVYQIATPSDLNDFAKVVNGGEASASAVITADLDMTGVDFTPIGTSDVPFAGTLNGQFHTIDNLVLNKPDDVGVALVAYGAAPCSIKSLTLGPNSSISGKSSVAGFLGCAKNGGFLYLSRLCNMAKITAASGDAGGLLGTNLNDAQAFEIKTCANFGEINGETVSGIGGWVHFANIHNSFNAGKVNGTHSSSHSFVRPFPLNAGGINNCYDIAGDGATKFEEADLASGKLCFLLNSTSDTPVWYQNIDAEGAAPDKYPVFDANGHAVVVRVGSYNCDGTPKEGVEVTYSNSGTGNTDPHTTGPDGICTVCGLPDPNFVEKSGEWYLLSTPQHMLWLAHMVNDAKEIKISAKLTCDLDMTGIDYIPIGTPDAIFKGKFDGQFHTIDNLVINQEDKDYLGVFGVVGEAAEIRHFVLGPNSSIRGNAHVGGIIGASMGGGYVFLSEVGNEASVYAKSNNASGLLGTNIGSNQGYEVKNCYNAGHISGAKENGGISGWGHLVQMWNCYNSGTVEGADSNSFLRGYNAGSLSNCYDIAGEQATGIGTISAVSASQVKSGYLCHQLNGNIETEDAIYRQNLVNNIDDNPTILTSHKVVIKKGGLGGYTNNEEKWAELIEVDGVYQIASPLALNQFAELVNGGKTDAMAIVTADIDMTDVEFTPIGTLDNPFKGLFNGKFHTIDNLVVYRPNEINQALFGVVTGGQTTIKNLILGPNSSITGKEHVSGFVASAINGDWVTLENLCNMAKITSGGDGAGGVFSTNQNNKCGLNIYSCCNFGEISGSMIGGLAGWAHYAIITNSFNVGKINATDTKHSKSFVRNLNAGEIKNCYDILGENATKIEEGWAASGKLCFLLNQTSTKPLWYQNIDVADMAPDAYPTFVADGHAVVYRTGDFYCSGTPKEGTVEGYSNTNSGSTDDHQFDKNTGICSACGLPDESFVEEIDSWYEIGTPGQLQWMAAMVNVANHTGLRVKLTADLDMTDVDYTPIGTPDAIYKGYFDGQFHVIDHLVINREDQDYIGIFGVVGSPAEIRHLTLGKNSSLRGNSHVGGIFGASMGGGWIFFSELGNEASIYAKTNNASGLLGTNIGGGQGYEVKNCYNAGPVSGANENGGISAWGHNVQMWNCYNSGTVEGANSNSFMRGFNAGGPLDNCYDVAGEQATGLGTIIATNAAAVKSGALCYKLNQEQATADAVYRQNLTGNDIDDNPVLLPSHLVVAKKGLTYTNPDAAGIEELIPEEEISNHVFFTIDGRRIERPNSAGIYIMDGKKVLVK